MREPSATFQRATLPSTYTTARVLPSGLNWISWDILLGRLTRRFPVVTSKMPDLDGSLPAHDGHPIALGAPRDPPDVILVQPGDGRQVCEIAGRNDRSAVCDSKEPTDEGDQHHPHAQADT